MNKKSEFPKTIIISRTDKIGDVVLTLPMAGYIKASDPQTRIIFLGQPYTKAIIECSRHVDEFWDWKELAHLAPEESARLCAQAGAEAIIHVFPRPEIAKWAKDAGIPLRIGTRNRIYHWLRCNRLVKVSRRNSDAHESELNMSLLAGLGRINLPPASQLPQYYGLSAKSQLNDKFKSLIDSTKFNIILHPKSKGSAREWPIQKWAELAVLLPKDKFKVFISGGPDEEKDLLEFFPRDGQSAIVNIAGMMPLDQFIAFIAAADGLVAASTGPLHIAAALGRCALGLYPPIRPMHGGRWGPVGERASFLSLDRKCEDCRVTKVCACMESFDVRSVCGTLLKRFEGPLHRQEQTED
ncbi:MAG: lipopolysaccharide heptosyltransferase family protein [Proteobacteria bacterium]|nr:lipopolysaccharide heptosyltransferase family protein [Pseudomonadota bacterium]